MRVLVTGGGFIGRWLIKKLLVLNHQVFVLHRSEAIFSGQVSQLHGDVQDRQFVNGVIQKVQPEVVFHLAACKDRQQSLENIRRALDVNVIGTFNVLEACAQVKTLRSIVVMGTAEEYGNSEIIPFQELQRELPISGYSLSKTCQTYLCETLARIHGLPVVILRPSIVYGPEQGLEMFLPSLISALLRREEYQMTLGEQKRDFIHVEDLIAAMIKAMQIKDIRGEIINIGFGESVMLKALATQVAERLGRLELLKIGALVYRKDEIFDYNLDIEKANKLLQWAPKISLEQGLDETITYYKRALRL